MSTDESRDLPGGSVVQATELRAQQAVREAISAHHAVNAPVAMYDAEQKRPYLLHADGTRQYDL